MDFLGQYLSLTNWTTNGAVGYLEGSAGTHVYFDHVITPASLADVVVGFDASAAAMDDFGLTNSTIACSSSVECVLSSSTSNAVDHLVLQGNDIRSSSGACFKVSGSVYVSHALVTANHCKATATLGHYGLYLDGFTESTVSDNSFDGNGQVNAGGMFASNCYFSTS